MDPILIKVRMTCGAYLARAGKVQASCTMDAFHAASRVGSKVFGLLDERVFLKPYHPGCDDLWLALPATAPAEDLVGYKTAHQISDERLAAQKARVYGHRSNPGTMGDHLD